MTDTESKLFALDAAYKPFPSFEGWCSKAFVDTVRWDRYRGLITAGGTLSPDLLRKAREVAKRAAALDTGAIEGLYEVDRGFTYTVALETSMWEMALAEKGERVRSLFDAQLRAYDYVLDLATHAEPISEAAIRTLHEVVCAAQDTYRVTTAVGPQEQALPKGRYKSLSNHVRTRKGTDHSYAPVDVTPAEMMRLVNEFRSEAFLAAHPVLQASYAHYGLVVVHPFADGNGRVARALASAFTYRALSMPIVILSEQKDTYLDSLEDADTGNYQTFVDFMLSRCLDSMKLIEESIRSARVSSTEESVSAIAALYLTKGGYTHEQVDSAGKQVLNALHAEIQAVLDRNPAPRIGPQLKIGPGGYQVPEATYRPPIGGGLTLSVVLNAAPPMQVTVSRNYHLFLPRDPAGDDDIILGSRLAIDADNFTARLDEAIPRSSGVLQFGLRCMESGSLPKCYSNLGLKRRSKSAGANKTRLA